MKDASVSSTFWFWIFLNRQIKRLVLNSTYGISRIIYLSVKEYNFFFLKMQLIGYTIEHGQWPPVNSTQPMES